MVRNQIYICDMLKETIPPVNFWQACWNYIRTAWTNWHDRWWKRLIMKAKGGSSRRPSEPPATFYLSKTFAEQQHQPTLTLERKKIIGWNLFWALYQTLANNKYHHDQWSFIRPPSIDLTMYCWSSHICFFIFNECWHGMDDVHWKWVWSGVDGKELPLSPEESRCSIHRLQHLPVRTPPPLPSSDGTPSSPLPPDSKK